MQRVRGGLRDECQCDQDPRVDMGCGNFHPRPSEDNLKVLRAYWLAAYKAQDVSLMSGFLRDWPVSEYSGLARQWLAENRGKVSHGSTFAIKEKNFFWTFSTGYSVIKGHNLAPMIVTTEDPSKGQWAIVAVSELKVFSQPTASAGQIATLQIGDPIRILVAADKKEESGKGTSIWSKIAIETGKNGLLVGYVKDAVRINEDLQYKEKYVIKLKPPNRDDLLAAKVFASALGGKDLPRPISLDDKEAIFSQSSGLLNQIALSQASILVRLHNYIEGAPSAQVARTVAQLRKLHIRDALVASGANEENIFIEEPKVFLLGDKGKPGNDEVNIFLPK